MIKTQVQLPDRLYRELKRVAGEKEWSFAETVRRGAEYIISVNPPGRQLATDWKLPSPVNLGLHTDPFASEDWREDSELTSGTARLLAGQLREKAARYEAGT
jgi:hypothetical protein